jgi:hypothetical protein
MKIGIDVRFHRSRDRARTRLITISVNRPKAAGDDLSPGTATIPASAASEKPISEHQEGHNDAGGEDHASVKAQIADAADAAETEKSELPNATPPAVASQATDAADAADAAETEKFGLPKATPPSKSLKRRTLLDAGIKNEPMKPGPVRFLGKGKIPI